jgi:hypothetical protein
MMCQNHKNAEAFFIYYKEATVEKICIQILL